MEIGGAVTVEATAPLVVVEVRGGLGFGCGDAAEVGASSEPPSALPVVVLGPAQFLRRWVRSAAKRGWSG